MRVLLLLLICLWVLPAWADITGGGWATLPDGSVECTALTKDARQVCWYDFATDTDSKVLSTADCSSVSITFNPDEDGSDTVDTIDVYACEEKVASTTQCKKVLSDRNGDGVIDAADDALTLDGSTVGRQGMDGITAAWIFIQVNGGNDDARVTAVCFP